MGLGTGRGATLQVVLILLEQQIQLRYSDGDAEQKHRGGRATHQSGQGVPKSGKTRRKMGLGREGRTTHQSGQGVPKSRKTRRKTGLRGLNIPRGLACLCVAILFCSGSKLQRKHSGHSPPLTALSLQDALPPDSAGRAPGL